MNTAPPSQEENPVVEEYTSLAPEYDAKWPFYVEMSAQETMARLTIKPMDRVLDVGCGTGVLLDRLAHAHPQVELVGIDPVPEMLAVAHRRLSPTIRLQEGWAENLPFDDHSFDLVVSCNMFHYIRQPLIALQEMRRVLRVGGQLVITDWCNDDWMCRLCDWYLRLSNPAHFKVYRKRECSNLLQKTGYTEIGIENYKINWFWGLMTARAVKCGIKEL